MTVHLLRAFLFLGLIPIPLAAQQPADIVLEHANVIDPAREEPLLDQTIFLVGGKILAVSPSPISIPAAAIRIDLHGAWVLPGLIDAHIHPTGIEDARNMLCCGVTTGRSMLTTVGYVDVGLRALHARGDADIPTILAAGYPVLANPARFTPPVSAVFLDHPDLDDLRTADRVGPDGARRMVRAIASRKVDWIKVFANGRAGVLQTDPAQRDLNDDELAAAVDEATRLGLPAAAHAYSDDGASAAVRAGVRSIEHGSLITEPTLRLMRDRGVFFVPTLNYFEFELSPNAPEDARPLRPRARMLLDAGRQAVTTARRLGVPVVAGADSSYAPGETTVVDELVALVNAGLSNLEAIRAATSLSAECLGLAKVKGSVRPGQDADLAAFAEDPRRDLAALRTPILVINGGKVFLKKLPA